MCTRRDGFYTYMLTPTHPTCSTIKCLFAEGTGAAIMANSSMKRCNKRRRHRLGFGSTRATPRGIGDDRCVCVELGRGIHVDLHIGEHRQLIHEQLVDVLSHTQQLVLARVYDL